MFDALNATFSPKDPREVVTLNFDFLPFGTGWTAAVVICEYQQGISDDSPTSMVRGAVSINDSVISQDIGGGVDGTDYLITCTVTRGNNVYVISGTLPVRKAVGGFSQATILD